MKGYFHSTTLMQSFRTGLVSDRQQRARWGRSGGGLPLLLCAFLLAAAAAASAAAAAAAAAAGGAAPPAAVGAPAPAPLPAALITAMGVESTPVPLTIFTESIFLGQFHT